MQAIADVQAPAQAGRRYESALAELYAGQLKKMAGRLMKPLGSQMPQERAVNPNAAVEVAPHDYHNGFRLRSIHPR